MPYIVLRLFRLSLHWQQWVCSFLFAVVQFSLCLCRRVWVRYRMGTQYKGGSEFERVLVYAKKVNRISKLHISYFVVSYWLTIEMHFNTCSCAILGHVPDLSDFPPWLIVGINVVVHLKLLVEVVAFQLDPWLLKHNQIICERFISKYQKQTLFHHACFTPS